MIGKSFAVGRGQQLGSVGFGLGGGSMGSISVSFGGQMAGNR